MRLCAIRRRAPWLISYDVTRVGLIDFPTCLREMIRLSASTCTRYISAIWFLRLVSGYRDFTKFGHRYPIIILPFRRPIAAGEKSPREQIRCAIFTASILIYQVGLADLGNWPAPTLRFSSARGRAKYARFGIAISCRERVTAVPSLLYLPANRKPTKTNAGIPVLFTGRARYFALSRPPLRLSLRNAGDTPMAISSTICTPPTPCGIYIIDRPRIWPSGWAVSLSFPT